MFRKIFLILRRFYLGGGEVCGKGERRLHQIAKRFAAVSGSRAEFHSAMEPPHPPLQTSFYGRVLDKPTS